MFISILKKKLVWLEMYARKGKFSKQKKLFEISLLLINEKQKEQRE